ncbi:hypothetical protein ABZ569_32190 [Streptomyces albus]|uniref:hypothetical protein n=1 Tax=Streptomyces albus TaxID=1888 RepID=UPI0034062680
MSMFECVPPERQAQFETFMSAYTNTGRVWDAVTEWTDSNPRADLAPEEITAPSQRWVAEHTGLTDGMVATAYAAMIASGSVTPVREGVWRLPDPETVDTKAIQERLFGVLTVFTQVGMHTFTANRAPGRLSRRHRSSEEAAVDKELITVLLAAQAGAEGIAPPPEEPPAKAPPARAAWWRRLPGLRRRHRR